MKKTASGLVNYCLKQIGRPYWLGGFGQKATRELYDQNKTRLGYGSWDVYDQDVGKKVHDCCGMIKGYCWTDGPDAFWKSGQYGINECGDWGVDEMYRRCSETGSIKALPEIPGLLLFNASLGHVGIYIGNGELVEAHSTAKDVIKSKVANRNFTMWGKASWIQYDTEVKKPTPAPSTSKQTAVHVFQDWLNDTYGDKFKGDKAIGGYLSVDGGCGPKTKKAATYAMQVELNKLGEKLVLDGSCGKLTQAAMLKHLLKRGSKGNMVRIIQGLLYGAGIDPNGFDGSFGAGCEKAVKTFQERYWKGDANMVDGKVGGATLDKLTD